jgi:hypothetical protein
MKLNLNVNKDDLIINDFLQSWESLNKRPSKVNIYKSYDSEKFGKYFEGKFIEQVVQKDIIPFEDITIINERYFCKLNGNILLTYTIYDSLSDDCFVGELSFYYDFKESAELDKLILDLDEFSFSDEQEIQQDKNNLFSVILNQNGFDLEPIANPNLLIKKVENCYNDDVFKSLKKMTKKLIKNAKGLSIIHGERGTGKSSTIYFLSQKLSNKKFIYIPSNYFDLTLNNPEFKSFLKKHTNSVLILDDCELFFSEMYTKSNLVTVNILQMVDGLDSHNLNLNLILIMNCLDEKEIDSQLLSCNNLKDIIKVSPLKKSKVLEICKILKKKNKFETPVRLVEILNDKYQIEKDIDMGF